MEINFINISKTTQEKGMNAAKDVDRINCYKNLSKSPQKNMVKFFCKQTINYLNGVKGFIKRFMVQSSNFIEIPT